MTMPALQPLTEAGFAAFGDMFETPGETNRRDQAARLANARDAARANLAVIRAVPALLPHRISLMERHPFSNQFFSPLDGASYLVVVAHDDGTGAPDMASLRAFRAKGHQAINYAPGIWHCGMATLDRPGIFSMFVHEDGTADDTHFQDVAPFEVTEA
jgi:ureidoglycolate lyase